MDYQYLKSLKKNHPAWRLLGADSSPLIISFLHAVFIEKGIRSISQADITEKLDDYLYYLRDIYGEDVYPRSSREYLDEWAAETNGYLRKYYPHVGDEPEFDLTPAVEKAIEWIKSFEKREFIGTESRLLLIFRLLQELVSAMETDPEKRIMELERKKDEIDAEIAKARAGLISFYDETQIKERYWQIEDSSRQLLADFRGVEGNFRSLDRQARESIASSTKVKAKVLDEIFREQDAIEKSSQGKSFKAFWSFLMSQSSQKELESLTGKLMELAEIGNYRGDSRLPGLKYHLMEAGEKVKETVSHLNEQLRKFLDEQVWIENKRIMKLIQEIEQHAVSVRNSPPDQHDFIEIDDVHPDIELPMCRSLFMPPDKPAVLNQNPLHGEAEFITDLLYTQHYIDETVLAANIHKLLMERDQVSLAKICERYPPQKGLGELIAYIHIASKDEKSCIDTSRSEEIILGGNTTRVIVPLVVFTR